MEAKELRIGNFVLLDDCICSVLTILPETALLSSDEENEYFAYSDIEGIPLTEEIFATTGIKYRSTGNKLTSQYVFNIAGCIFYLTYNEYNDNWSICSDKVFGHLIMHVHQLQNLYFALTNQELKLK